MIGIYIGFSLMIFAAVFGWIEYRRLIKILKHARTENEMLCMECEKLYSRRTGSIFARTRKAEIVELTRNPAFCVYREFDGVKYAVKFIDYDPNDPEDREYKRIYAEEIADKLNEKP